MDEEATAAGGWWSYENGFQRWFERLQGHAPEGADPVPAAEGVLGWLWQTLLWVLGNLIEAVYNILYAITHPGDWLAWVPQARLSGPMDDIGAAESLARFIYYGASAELLFVCLVVFAVATGIGMARREIMWAMVRGLEGIANGIGRFAAWAGLLMVLQQIVIIFLQRIFAVSEISIGLGKVFTQDVSWWSEELKLYNAMIVSLCVSWTFVQGGHVRVDLVYSAVSYRTKRVIDMVGSLLFMVPAAILVWLYAWFFLWRHLVVPNPSASAPFDRMMQQARALRWNVETISFSPNGFNAYFLFKLLLVMFTALVLLQAVAFFYRSYLEWREGPESEGRYLDRDRAGGDAPLAVQTH